ncbi:MAG: hypothetical protein ACLFN3_00235 [Halochromatium sp.]
MKYSFQTLAAVILYVVASVAWAEEVRVSPGTGTLGAAIGAARSGDTLVLEDGAFFGDVTVLKSLTIRPLNRNTNAVIKGTVAVEAPAGEVTLQGLKFENHVYLWQADAINLLENQWLNEADLLCNGYRSSEGDGALVIVGNRFAAGSVIDAVHTDGAYIAGNVLLNGYISTFSYAWIVGNDVYRNPYDAIYAGAGTKALILANRVRCEQSRFGSCLKALASLNLVAGNIIESVDTSNNSHTQHLIYSETLGETIILNNVMRGFSPASRSGAGIYVEAGQARVSGNIIVDWISSSGTPIEVVSAAAEITNNLCDNNSGSCPEGEGNLDQDPEFVDLDDYQLAATSPAIDAGPADYGLSDLDRTRNDMGAHGGPWSIGQYDAQRAPGNLAPFVYPLFEIGSNLSGGLLDVRALGVARLR